MIDTKADISFKEQILYQDSDLVVVNKLPGQLVQSDKNGNFSLLDYLCDYLKAENKQVGNPGVIHRIDRPASGIVVFALKPEVLAKMNMMLVERKIKKIYWAVTDKVAIDKKQELLHYIYINRKINKSFIHPEPKEKYKIAKLIYEIIAEGDRYMLLQIELITGRQHQIRAQLAAIGLPVKGDIKYGSRRTNKEGLIHLHAREINFVHPLSGEKMHFIAPPPPDKLWDYFEAAVRIQISSDIPPTERT